MRPESSDIGQTQWTLEDALEGEVDEEVSAEVFLPRARETLVPPRAAILINEWNNITLIFLSELYSL